MSASTKNRSAGFTVMELIVAIAVSSILVGVLLTVTFSFYGSTIRTSAEARLAVESQTILRSVVEELRVSSGIRGSNSIVDPNAPVGGWTTSNAALVLIISTPVINASNDYVMDPDTGVPHQNELVYYAVDNHLYKRYLANPGALGNQFQTSCPPTMATASCPSDVLLSEHFTDMNFIFYDQDNAVTTVLAEAQSIDLTINMEQQSFGQLIEFSNGLRMTLRNNL